ncbi:MAG: hypothetical protein PVG65_06860 [Candidatus Thorarchaeota archaeon]
MTQKPVDSAEEKSENNVMDLKMTLAVIRTIEAEKRTHLAELRTGIGILTIPFSLTTILIATSNYYEIEEVSYLIIGLVIGILVLTIIGGYLVVRSLKRIRRTDSMRAGISISSGDYLIMFED